MKKNQEVQALLTQLYQIVGNKRYMHEISELFSKLDPSDEESRALIYLIQDLRFDQVQTHQLKNNVKRGNLF